MFSLIKSKLDALHALCKRHHVRALYLFGSATRDDFEPETSDLDFLVEFQPEVRVTFRMLDDVERELSELFERKVDLLTRSSIEQSPNFIRRRAILESMEPVYRAA
ncbi:MAG: nucleotidyltransferase [Phycisphaerales bacterium]|nr:MAG: nucleotidyltransferase [Phycisphaerales bacterium]